jgi:hypothetical protein
MNDHVEFRIMSSTSHDNPLLLKNTFNFVSGLKNFFTRISPMPEVLSRHSCLGIKPLSTVSPG